MRHARAFALRTWAELSLPEPKATLRYKFLSDPPRGLRPRSAILYWRSSVLPPSQSVRGGHTFAIYSQCLRASRLIPRHYRRVIGMRRAVMNTECSMNI
jgi:hypothetical protein